VSEYSWYRALEPNIKFKNVEDLKKQIKNEEKRCYGRPNTIKLMRLRDLLNEFEKMNLNKFLKKEAETDK
jgi:hypothetical protein